MGRGEIVKPREIVKANNSLFRCKYKIKDVVAGRIFMAFASLVDHNDIKDNQSFVKYKISAHSILQDTCLGGDNYRQLQDAARILIDQKIVQQKHSNHFKYYSLFSTIEYENGIITGEFHKDLIPFFLIAKAKFTKMKLYEYMKLPSIYSQFIFSFLKSWDDKNEIIIKLTDLHNMLDTPKSLRNNFYDFKRRVLDKSYKDINDRTSLHYEWEAIRNGRAVSEIKFIFINKKINKIKYNQQAVTILQSNLADFVPFCDTKQGKYEAFLNKFYNGGSYRHKIWKIWYDLYDEGKAPLANDVNYESNPIDFIKQWKDKYEDVPHSK